MHLRLAAGIALICVTALDIGTSSAARAQSDLTYTYTTLIPFGASLSPAEGINDAGQIVGFYRDAAQGFSGYLGMVGSSTYMTIAAPDHSTNTIAHGISNSGQIVGTYVDLNSGNHSGFSAAAGSTSFTAIDPFNASFAEALSINTAGQIGGDYQVPGSAPGMSGIGTFYGYVRSANGDFTTVDPFGSEKTIVSGINDLGQIVGYYDDAATNKQLGYVGTVGTNTFTTIDPFGAFDAGINGINNAGQIVGYYVDPQRGNDLGFVGTLGSSDYAVVDPFHSQFAFVSGINTAGQIVGEYQDPVSGNYYGFLGTPEAPVPEASTTVSFGLLLALGLGGVVIAARKKKAAASSIRLP